MFLFFIMISTVFISGCWSQKELNELAIISAMAIDKNEDGKYVKTIQFVNPGNVAGGLQGGGGGQGPAVTVYTATGDTILEAHINASAKVSRRLYHAHANLLVISEEVAREEGIDGIIDAFERDPEVRTESKIVIARDAKAGDIVKSLTSIDKVPSEKVNKTLLVTERARGENIVVSIQDFISVSASLGREPVISGFRIKGEPEKGKKMENVQQSELDATLEASGLAVFKEEKLIDWYEGDLAKGTMWILDKIQQTDVKVSWKGKKNAVVYNVIRQKTNVSADTKNTYPEMTIHVRAEGDIRELTTPVDITDPAVISDLEKEIEKEIKKQLEKAVTRTQKNNSDIFGFGEVVHRTDPEKWKKMKRDWDDEYFPYVNVNVKVDAFIRRTGLRTNSFHSNTEK
ncbi:Ger(x)C family spore germination protein [Domibacillus iocasae]